MNKKKFTLLITLMLAVCIIFTSCNTAGRDSAEGTKNPGTAAPEQTNDGSIVTDTSVNGFVNVITEGNTEFKFISVSDDNKDMNYSICSYAAGKIKDTFGAVIGISIKKSNAEADDTKSEIVVGLLQNEGNLNEEDIKQLNKTGYIIKTENNKIFIAAGSLSAGKAAVDEIIAQYGNTDKKDLIVPRGITIKKHIPEDQVTDETNKPEKPSTNKTPKITYGPVVYVVGNEYQIMFNTNVDGMASVKIGSKTYHDSYAGIIKTESNYHKVVVPMEELDEAKAYTVIFTVVEKRPAYFPKPGQKISKDYTFRPVDMSDGLQMYTISDSHSIVTQSVAAAKYYGDKLDLLVLCGDISAESDSEANMFNLVKIAYNATKGSIPVIYARGNHETRGEYAEKIANYVASDNGQLYYTFRIGSIWGIVIDAGEDKLDSHDAYGGMVDFAGYRKTETEFLKRVVANADSEYNAEGVEYRIAICHVPFPVFDEGHDTARFKEWTSICSEMSLDIMITGHLHKRAFHKVGSASAEQNYVVAVCSDGPNTSNFVGAAITLNGNEAELEFTNQNLKSIAKYNWSIG